MDFADERYVRLYTRNTATWQLLGFEGRTVLMHAMRILDRAGVLETAGLQPANAISLMADIPIDFATKGVDRLLQLGVAVQGDNCVVFPRFISAQETIKTDAARQRESREKRRDKAKLTPDLSHGVTSVANAGPNVTRVTLAVTPVTPAVTCVTPNVTPSTPSVPNHAEPPKPSVPVVTICDDVESWTRVWWLYEKALGLKSGQGGYATKHTTALMKIAKAVEVECGFPRGDAFDEFATKVLRAWLNDPWVKAEKPTINHLVSRNELQRNICRAREAHLPAPLKPGELPPANYETVPTPADVPLEAPTNFLARMGTQQAAVSP